MITLFFHSLKIKKCERVNFFLLLILFLSNKKPAGWRLVTKLSRQQIKIKLMKRRMG